LLVAFIGTAAVSLADHVLRRRQDPRPGADIQGQMSRQLGESDGQDVYRNWRDVCEWVRTTTAPEACFLTPLGQQTFKWYGQRSEVVNWKDVPQNAVGLVEWWRRYRQVRAVETPSLTTDQYVSRVRALARQYDFQYLLAARSATPARTGLPLVYANRWFAVYRVDRPAVDVPG
jgi:hypothetical protein